MQCHHSIQSVDLSLSNYSVISYTHDSAIVYTTDGSWSILTVKQKDEHNDNRQLYYWRHFFWGVAGLQVSCAVGKTYVHTTFYSDCHVKRVHCQRTFLMSESHASILLQW